MQFQIYKHLEVSFQHFNLSAFCAIFQLFVLRGTDSQKIQLLIRTILFSTKSCVCVCVWLFSLYPQCMCKFVDVAFNGSFSNRWDVRLMILETISCWFYFTQPKPLTHHSYVLKLFATSRMNLFLL